MPEGPNPGPARRGRRSPAIQAEIEAPRPLDEDTTLLAEVDDEQGDTYFAEGALDPGDVVAAKVVHQVSFDGGDPSWITYGVQSHVRPGESDEDAFERIVRHVNDGAADMIVDAGKSIENVRDVLDARPAGVARRRR